MKKVFSIIFIALLVLSSISFGQDQYFVLREIFHNRWDDRMRTPDRVGVNSSGGFVEFTVNYYENCTERYRFEFSFDQEMNVLKAGEQCGFTTRTKVLTEPCNDNRDPFLKAGAANGSTSSLITGTSFRPLVNGLGMASGWDRLCAKGILKGGKTGSLRGVFAPAVHNKLNAYSWLKFCIDGSSNLGK